MARVRIHLSKAVIAECERLAEEMEQVKRVGDKGGWSEGGYESHLIGLFGEYAVRQYLEIPDEDVNRIVGTGDGGIDLWIVSRSGRKVPVDVKTRRWEKYRWQPDLWVYYDQENDSIGPAELYIVCVADLYGRVEIIGKASQRQVREEGKLHDRGEGKPKRFSYILDHTKITPMRNIEPDIIQSGPNEGMKRRFLNDGDALEDHRYHPTPGMAYPPEVWGTFVSEGMYVDENGNTWPRNTKAFDLARTLFADTYVPMFSDELKRQNGKKKSGKGKHGQTDWTADT